MTHEHFVAQVWPASTDAVVEAIIAEPTDEGDGWSGWVWMRLSNGDLILGRFPQGVTYEGLETTVEEDYVKAEKRLNSVEEGLQTINNEYDGDE